MKYTDEQKVPTTLDVLDSIEQTFRDNNKHECADYVRGYRESVQKGHEENYLACQIAGKHIAHRLSRVAFWNGFQWGFPFGLLTCVGIILFLGWANQWTK